MRSSSRWDRGATLRLRQSDIYVLPTTLRRARALLRKDTRIYWPKEYWICTPYIRGGPYASVTNPNPS
jgi:hypothetical protein